MMKDCLTSQRYKSREREVASRVEPYCIEEHPGSEFGDGWVSNGEPIFDSRSKEVWQKRFLIGKIKDTLQQDTIKCSSQRRKVRMTAEQIREEKEPEIPTLDFRQSFFLARGEGSLFRWKEERRRSHFLTADVFDFPR